MRLDCLIIWVFLAVSCNDKPITTDGIQVDTTQKRLPGESYDEAEERYRGGLSKLNLDEYTDSLSVINAGKKFEDLDFSQLAEFGSLKTFTEAFEEARDHQFLTSEERPEILRRSTWLYPDDGCFARADLIVRNLPLWNTSKVHKIFVFGELAVSTENSKSGEVYWWFHIVPIAKVGGVNMVMDPSVDPSAPMTLEDWADAISSDVSSLKFSLCSAGSYIPYSRCDSASVGSRERAMADQSKFLEPEWTRLVALGRDPEAELGESPPWLQ